MNSLTRIAVLAALALGAGTAAEAAAVCSGCERVDGSAGTYLGQHDPATDGVSTFQHTDVRADVGSGNTDFADYFALDLMGAANGSVSADYTDATRVKNFAGNFYADDGTTACGALPGSGCSTVGLGALLGSAVDSNGRWEILLNNLTPGRYVIEVLGRTRPGTAPSAYSGQVAFEPSRDDNLPEPGSLALLGVGLLGLGAARRRR